MDKKAVAYYRVSTSRQGESGLGLESQVKICNHYAKETGFKIVNSFTEIESGKKNNRVKLNAALEECSKNGYKLIIAKLDRLSRNAAFTMQLHDSGVDFVACDLPEANTLTIGLVAVMAQYERELISNRTKLALGVLKARGVKLGNPENLTKEAQLKGSHIQRDNAVEHYKKIAGYLKLLQENGLSLRKIAAKVNSEGHRTVRNTPFTAATVKRIIDRASHVVK